jgi:TM2 domain-containing membrane protein YozV
MVPHKEKGTAYVLLIVPSFFGIAGLHRFYLGQVGMGILYLFTFGFLGIGLIIDLFTLSGMVDKYNLMQNALYGQQPQQAQPQNVVVNLAQNVAQNTGQINPAQPAAAVPDQNLPPQPQVVGQNYEEQPQLAQPNPQQHLAPPPPQQQPEYPPQQNLNRQVDNSDLLTDKINISCTHCGQIYKNISAKHRGRTVNCKKCQQTISI